MTEDQLRWEEQNEAYLAAALNWLRLRLERLAGPENPPSAPAPPAPPRSGFFSRREERPAALLAAPGGPSDADIEKAAAEMAATEAVDPPPALVILARRFGLSRFEQEALLLCTALELDTGIAGLCARAQHDPSRPYPTFALMVALFDDPAWDLLSPERPLRYWRLIEINQPGAEPLTTSALRADERIVNYVKGLNYLDDRLAPLLIPFEATLEGPLPPSQQAAAVSVEQTLRLAADNGSTPLVQLVGIDPVSKQLVAQQAAAALAVNLYRMPVEALPQQPGEMESLARLWQRENILLPIALFLDAHELDGEPKGDAAAPDRVGALQRFLARSRGVFLLSTREQRALGTSMHAVHVHKPLPSEQLAAWSEALGNDAGETPALLAGQFNLNIHTIRQVVRSVRARERSSDEQAEDERVAVEVEDTGAEGEGAVAEREAEGAAAEATVVEVGPTLEERLWDACLEVTGPQMDRLAQRLTPVATWDDIVLPPEEMNLLRQLASQVARRTTVYDRWGFRQRMNRGLGINALFAGESGTGKTMAAEVIANHLRLNLYRIDLSAVVSKYIGETEKNLRRVFDAAEGGGALLFFDEADALFGKRSEVRDSHDRYANIEINYLLQRMESYRGLAILATNMKSALDQAFMRRLRFVVNFPFPGKAQRRAIWERAWPPETPQRGLDFDRLARFNLTGGSIANVALNSAFMAAERGSPVTMPLVLEAVRSEFRKLERPWNDADLHWTEPEEPAAAGGSPPAGPDPAAAA